MPWSPEDIRRLVEVEARLQEVDPQLALGVARQESGFNPTARSPKGAYGVMQLMPGTARALGINAQDVGDNIRGGITYLKQQLTRYGGDPRLALAAYNAGPSAVDAYKDVPPFKETRGYVQRILGAITPASAEAAPSPPAATGRSRLDEIEAELARREAQDATQQVPQATTTPPPVSQTGAAPGRATGQPEPPSDLVIDIEKASPSGPGQPVAQPKAVSLVTLTPDMDDDAILRNLGYDPALVKQAKLYQPGAFQSRLTDPQSSLASVMNSPLGGLLRGLRDPAEGVLQLGTRGLRKLGIYSDADVAYHDALIKLAEADYQQNIRKGEKVDPQTGQSGIFSDPARLAGSALAVPIPAGGAATWGGAALRGAATGAVMGATQPVLTASPTPGSETDPYWQEKGGQATAGALTGGITTPLAEKVVAPVVNRLWNWGRGVVQPAYQELLDLSERYGVRLSYGDVTRGAMAPKVETGIEAVPGMGGGRFRVAQQAEVRHAGEGVQQELATSLRQTPWRDLGAVQRAATQGNREAQALLAEMNAAGDDFGRVVQASGKLNLWQDRQQGHRLYGEVERLAQPLGNMRPTRAIAAIDEALSDVESQALLAPEVKSAVQGTLRRVRGEIAPTESVQPSMGVRDPVTGTLRAEPVTPRTTLPDTSYERMRKLVSNLQRLQRNAAEGETAFHLGAVQRALRADMDDFAERSGVPELVAANRRANAHWRDRVVRYEEGPLARAIERDLPDEIYQQFTRRGADRAQYFYNGLDPKGQAAVRYGMVQEAMEKAMGGPQPDVFSPARFATALRKIQDAHQVFFRGHPQWEIDGLTRLMQHAQRAGQYMENPPTGWRAGVIGGLIGGGGMVLGQPGTLAMALGSTKGLQLLLMTERGRNLLLAANTVQPGSPAMQRVLDQVMRYSPRPVEAWFGRREGAPR